MIYGRSSGHRQYITALITAIPAAIQSIQVNVHPSTKYCIAFVRRTVYVAVSRTSVRTSRGVKRRGNRPIVPERESSQ